MLLMPVTLMSGSSGGGGGGGGSLVPITAARFVVPSGGVASFQRYTGTITSTSGNFGLSLWLRVSAYPSTEFALRGTQADDSATARLTLQPTGAIKFLHSEYDGKGHTTFVSLTSPSAVPLNAWTHVVVVRNGSTVSLHINGVQVASATQTSAFTVPLFTSSSSINPVTTIDLALYHLVATTGAVAAADFAATASGVWAAKPYVRAFAASDRFFKMNEAASDTYYQDSANPPGTMSKNLGGGASVTVTDGPPSTYQ